MTSANTQFVTPGPGDATDPTPAAPCRVLLLGATGTIGRATARALHRHGREVVCLVRAPKGPPGSGASVVASLEAEGITVRIGNALDPDSLARDGFRGEAFDVLVSCLASRTGAPRDAWAIDHQAHLDALRLAREAGVRHFVLLSAICVQKPKLAFQHAKLAFEQALMASGLRYSIVRPTAYFKSLTGQVARVRAGKAYLLFGDGRLTACKPISDRDLGEFLARCIADPACHDRVLPIGGPGPALTPRALGEHLFATLGRPPKFSHVPVRLLDLIIGALSLAARVLPSLAAKAELARIGRYYATESMLVLDPGTGCYSADATPSFGRDTLFDFQASLLAGRAVAERGEHAVF